MAKENKTTAVTQAKKVARLQKKGDSKKSHKTYSKVRFYKPKTLKKSRTPTYARSIRSERPKKDGFDKYDVLQRPVATEKAMKKMEEENTMVPFLSRSSCAPLVLIRIKLKKPLSVFTTPKLEV
jgi:large subunit ribosomal protein L23Ae